MYGAGDWCCDVCASYVYVYATGVAFVGDDCKAVSSDYVVMSGCVYGKVSEAYALDLGDASVAAAAAADDEKCCSSVTACEYE